MTGPRSGLTLIEVVVATTIAGTLLVSTILSAADHQRQLRAIERKEEVLTNIDCFLNTWSRGNFAADDLLAAASDSKTIVNPIAGVIAIGSERVWLKVSVGSVQQDLMLETIRVEGFVENAKQSSASVEIARPRKEQRQ